MNQTDYANTLRFEDNRVLDQVLRVSGGCVVGVERDTEREGSSRDEQDEEREEREEHGYSLPLELKC